MAFDKYGRRLYDPELHGEHSKPWSEEDTQYLIDWYYKLGPDEISFELGRTLTAVQQRAHVLRKSGRLVMPKVFPRHKRTR